MGAEEARLFTWKGTTVVLGDALEALFLQLVVTIEEEWKGATNTTVSRYGKLDVLVNNADISGRFHSDIMSAEAWDKLMEVNAKGVFLGIKHAIPEMRKVGGGSVVNISPISGLWAKI